MILLSPTSWEIKETTNKGKGIFTRRTITAGTIIGDYIGKVIKTAEEDVSEKNGLYLLYYHDYASIYPIDITKPGIHLINHSCIPNCGITIYKGHTLFFTLRKIFANEELTVSYQLSPGNYCNPCAHACYCGFINCTGTMHLSEKEFKIWNSFIEKEARKTKRARITYGKPLALLKDYPESIPDHPAYILYAASNKPARINYGKQLPSFEKIRQEIREFGQPLYFPSMEKTIVGIKNDVAISTT